jgi:hypothetical protein
MLTGIIISFLTWLSALFRAREPINMLIVISVLTCLPSDTVKHIRLPNRADRYQYCPRQHFTDNA